MTSRNITIIDIGDMVLCDLCNADYTDSEAEGGILMGTYSICPTCAPGVIRNAERTGEPFVRCGFQIVMAKFWWLRFSGGIGVWRPSGRSQILSPLTS